jgi:hypothetical protein
MMKTSIKGFFAIAAVAGVAFVMSMAPARALTVDVIPTNTGITVGSNSLLFSVDLTGLGLSLVSSITLIDDGIIAGGADGVFSGFDLDGLVLDVDGDPTTTGDQFSPLSFLFQAGSQRATLNQNQQGTVVDGTGTNPAVPGPVFGADDATTIDQAQATLGIFDAVSSDNVNTAFGFLTFGDNGELIVNFADIAIGDSLFLLFAEVGGQSGEEILVRVSQVPLPGAVWLFLTGLMALIGFSRRRKIATA